MCHRRQWNNSSESLRSPPNSQSLRGYLSRRDLISIAYSHIIARVSSDAIAWFMQANFAQMHSYGGQKGLKSHLALCIDPLDECAHIDRRNWRCGSPDSYNEFHHSTFAEYLPLFAEERRAFLATAAFGLNELHQLDSEHNNVNESEPTSKQ